MNKKVTAIYDRGELGMVCIERDFSELASVYLPTLSSKSRIARLATRLFEAKQLKCSNPAPRVYAYRIERT